MSKLTDQNSQLTLAFPTAAQHNLLVRYPMRMTLYEARIFALMLRCLHADMKAAPEVIRISVKDVVGTDKPPGNIYPLIKRACRALYAKDLNLLPIGADKDDVKSTRIVQDIEHIKGTGYIEGTFTRKITTYLLQLKENGNFTIGEIEQLMRLRNANSHRVYWYLKSWDGKPELIVPIDEFRHIILGEDAVKYKAFGQFNRAILTPVMEELSTVGFHVDYRPLQKGKTVTGLRFTYSKEKKNTKKELFASSVSTAVSSETNKEVISGNVEYKKLWGQMLSLGLSEHQTAAVMKAAKLENSEDYKAVRKVWYEIYVYQRTEKVANPGAVAYARLKDKYKIG